MAYDYLKESIGIFTAGEDFADWQYRVVQANSLNSEVIWQKPPISGSGIASGILVNAPKKGQACHVQIGGIGKVVLGGNTPILASREVGYLPDGTVTEGGNFGITLSGGQPGELIQVLLRPSTKSADNFSYDRIYDSDKVQIPIGQQMTVHGGTIIVEGSLLVDGTLYIEE